MSYSELIYVSKRVAVEAKPQLFWDNCKTADRIWRYHLLKHTAREIGTHYSEVIMGAMVSQITSFMVVYSTVYSGADIKTSQLRVTGLRVGNSPVTGEFPAQTASNAEKVSIWWRHHAWLAVITHAGANDFISLDCIYLKTMAAYSMDLCHTERWRVALSVVVIIE